MLSERTFSLYHQWISAATNLVLDHVAQLVSAYLSHSTAALLSRVPAQPASKRAPFTNGLVEDNFGLWTREALSIHNDVEGTRHLLEERLSKIADPLVRCTAVNDAPNAAIAAILHKIAPASKSPEVFADPATSALYAAAEVISTQRRQLEICRALHQGNRSPPSETCETASVASVTTSHSKGADGRKRLTKGPSGTPAKPAPTPNQVPAMILTAVTEPPMDVTAASFSLDAKELVRVMKAVSAAMSQAAEREATLRRRVVHLERACAVGEVRTAVAQAAASWSPSSYVADQVCAEVDRIRLFYEATLHTTTQQAKESCRAANSRARKYHRLREDLELSRAALAAAEHRANQLANALTDLVAVAPLHGTAAI
jgi:hypothetical protein